MRLFELEQPAVGDILEIELGDAIVEAVITAIEGDEIIAETDNRQGASILAESYGKYYCSTDKKWKTRKGPKQTRKVSEDQGVAEGSLEEYGNTARGQKMLTKVHKRAVDRVIKADDKNRLEPDYTKRDLKTVRKNQATADRAWDRMSDLDEQGVAEEAAGVGIITKQNSTKDVNKSTPRKNLKAFRLVK